MTTAAERAKISRARVRNERNYFTTILQEEGFVRGKGKTRWGHCHWERLAPKRHVIALTACSRFKGFYLDVGIPTGDLGDDISLAIDIQRPRFTRLCSFTTFVSSQAATWSLEPTKHFHFESKGGVPEAISAIIREAVLPWLEASDRAGELIATDPYRVEMPRLAGF